MKVVISYTNDGDRYADSLERDLKSQSIGIWIDKHCIEPGKNWLKEIDRALYQIEYVLGVITPNYLESIGGDEAYAKMAEGFRKKEMRFIPLFFMPIEEVKSVLIPALEGFKFAENYETGLKELVSFLKKEQKENPGSDSYSGVLENDSFGS